MLKLNGPRSLEISFQGCFYRREVGPFLCIPRPLLKPGNNGKELKNICLQYSADNNKKEMLNCVYVQVTAISPLGFCPTKNYHNIHW